MSELFWTESVSFKQKHYKRVFPVQGVESTESSVKVKSRQKNKYSVFCTLFYFPPVVVVYSSAVIWKTLPWHVVKSLCSLLHEYHFANGRIMHLYLGASKMRNNANHQLGTIQIEIDDIKACEVVQKKNGTYQEHIRWQLKRWLGCKERTFYESVWCCVYTSPKLSAVTMWLSSCTQQHSTRPLISLTLPTQHLQGLLSPAVFLSGGWWLVMRLLLCTLLIFLLKCGGC